MADPTRTLSKGTVDPFLIPTNIFDHVYQPYQEPLNPTFWDTVQAHFGFYYGVYGYQTSSIII